MDKGESGSTEALPARRGSSLREDPTLSEDYQHPRTATRAPLDRPLKLQFDDAGEVVDGHCANISIGGMQVHMLNPRPQGSQVRFELEIGEGTTVRGIGEVIWSRAQDLGPGREAGMGIKFRLLDQRDRQVIFRLVSEHIKERLAQKHPPAEELEEPVPKPFVPSLPKPSFATPPLSTPPLSTPSLPTPPLAPAAPWTTAPAADERLFDAAPLVAPSPVDSDVIARPPVTSLFQRESSARDFSDETLERPSFELGFDEPLQAGPDELGGRHDAGQPDDSQAFYRPPPPRRREVPVLPIVALLVVVGIVVVYLYRDAVFGPPERPVGLGKEGTGVSGTPPEAATPSGPGAGEAPAEGGAETPRATLTPLPPPSASPPETSPPPPASSPRPAAPPPSAPPPPAPPPPAPPVKAKAFSHVVDIRWTRQPGGVKVEIEVDGEIPEARYDHFRLEGESPREVIRLRGVVARYAKTEIPITGASVSRIRVGYHANKELHVVLDMLDRSSRVSKIRNQDGKLEVYVE